jgi:hypothetical protein
LISCALADFGTPNPAAPPAMSDDANIMARIADI